MQLIQLSPEKEIELVSSINEASQQSLQLTRNYHFDTVRTMEDNYRNMLAQNQQANLVSYVLNFLSTSATIAFLAYLVKYLG